ncbi:hypothetical protein V1477_015694 [Vespula maculifrons]|uniref:Uncharacterized protein n=1 Tax=Vespula maculifrons TaxID=7453 RepID=A0ABD2BAW9_VESMC
MNDAKYNADDTSKHFSIYFKINAGLLVVEDMSIRSNKFMIDIKTTTYELWKKKIKGLCVERSRNVRIRPDALVDEIIDENRRAVNGDL